MENNMTANDQIKTPGNIVSAAMEAKGWQQPDLAYVLGATPAAVSQIINDKRAISVNMAKALSLALSIPAEEIVAAQAHWDLKKADNSDPTIETRSKILSRYPLRDMIKRGWIDEEHPTKSVERQVSDFFGVASLDEVPHLTHSAKKTNYEEVPPSQLAWLFRVKQITNEMVVPAFSPEKLKEAMTELKALRIAPEAVSRVPRLLNDAGVRFVVVEAMPNSRIDGVCFWLDSKSPVIGISMRFDRIDNFWFVLAHECSHVLHGHGKGSFIVDSDMFEDSANTVDEDEQIANRDAADFCVPSDKMKSFIDRKKPFFSERDVVAFATIHGVHPGLVVGQIQRAIKRYDILRKYLVNVRKSLAMSMMMDGWGDMIPTER
jgi:HTH-type transcriptional regulator / antitoxin HigA